jgi:aminoglycoside phosphotransferase (APT) family kinase protein
VNAPLPETATVASRLTPWLAARRPDWETLRIDRVAVDRGGGWSADILFLDASYGPPAARVLRPLVLRRQAETFALVLGGELAFQGKVMAGLGLHPEVPTAALIGVEPSDALLGASFLVMERIAGQPARQAPNYNVEGWLTALSPARRGHCWGNAIAAFARLHAIDWRDGFAFLDRPERGAAGLDQYLAYLEQWYRWAAQGRPQPIADIALDHVLRARPAHAPVNLLWGDATPSNILFRDDGSVAALIDWELAALGPGEIDLAWWLYFDELFSSGFGVRRLPGLPDRARTIALYERTAGRAVRDLDYYDILTGLRMAIVAVRQFDRQVALGRLDPANRSFTDNLMTQYLARRLGLPVPELGPDFDAYLASHIAATEDAALEAQPA